MQNPKRGITPKKKFEKHRKALGKNVSVPSTIGVQGIRNLDCPACGNSVPVSRASVYVKCNVCGAPLRRVNIRKRR